VKNLKNSLDQISQLSKLSAAESLNIGEEEGLFEKINFKHHLDRIKSFFSSFGLGQDSARIQEKLNMDLVSEFSVDSRESFEKLIDEMHVFEVGVKDDEGKKRKADEFARQFEFFAKILVKNQEYLFEKDTGIFKEFDMDQKFIGSLETVSKCVNILLSYVSKYDMNKNLIGNLTIYFWLYIVVTQKITSLQKKNNLLSVKIIYIDFR